MPRFIDSDEALGAVHGKTVAVVGNTPEILDLGYGARIDEHEVVIRMNRGVPTDSDLEGKIGKRTTTVTAGQLRSADSPDPLATWEGRVPPYVWWLKHTALGAQHLDEVSRHPAFADALIWHWPEAWFRDLAQRLGASPSAGLSVLDILARRARPALIAAFGITCWGALEPGSRSSWWQPTATHRFHSPAAEAAFIRAMGREVRGRLWFELPC